MVEAYLHNRYRVWSDFVYRVSRDFARSCRTPMLVMPDAPPRTCDRRGHRVTGAERRSDG